MFGLPLTPADLAALVLVAAAVLASGRWVVRLPEPAEAAEVAKRPYRTLGWRWWLAVLPLALMLAWSVLDLSWSWAWLVWASLGLVLATVDAATTFLPRRLQHVVSAALSVALTRGLLTQQQPLMVALTIVAGALAAGVLFWLFWRVGGGLGFGDVRLGVSVGALAGAHGWPFWWAALLLGTSLGALIGVVVAIVRRWRPHPEGTVFPYGPALWAGPWLALLVDDLLLTA